MLEADKVEKTADRERTLAERVPPLQLSGLSLQDLQVNGRNIKAFLGTLNLFTSLMLESKPGPAFWLKVAM